MLISAACASVRKAPGADLPVREPTTYEQAMAVNYTIASTNRFLAEAIIESQRRGVVSVEWTAKATKAQFDIAEKQESLTIILKRGPEAARLEGEAIRAIIKEIAGLAKGVQESGTAPPSMNESMQRAGAIVALADQFILLLTSAGVLK